MTDPQIDHSHEAQAESGAAVVRGSKLALTAMILGIPGLCITPLGIAALVLGIVALVQIANPQRHLAGKGMALAGTILGGTSIVLLPFMALMVGILLPALGAARNSARDSVDWSSLRQVGLAMHGYAADHDDILPTHPRELTPYLVNLVQPQSACISAHHDPGTPLDRGDSTGPAVRYGSYVFLLMGTSTDSIQYPSQTVLAYRASGSNSQRQRAVLFADGHCQLMLDQDLRDMLPPEVDVDALDGP